MDSGGNNNGDWNLEIIGESVVFENKRLPTVVDYNRRYRP